MEVFKVTRYDNTSIRQGKYAIIYKPEVWTTPAEGKLFAFDQIDSLINFINLRYRQTNWRFWRCEADNPQPLLFCPYLPIEFSQFWKNFPERYIGTSVFPAPRGTLVCDRIKLLGGNMLISITEEHIKQGEPNSLTQCPIALSLKERFPDFEIRVG